MADAKHTHGPVCIEEPMDDLWIVKANQQSYEWEPLATIPLEYETSGITKAQARANAELFVEAINVATETGMTPRQIVRQLDNTRRDRDAAETNERHMANQRAAIAKAEGAQ